MAERRNKKQNYVGAPKGNDNAKGGGNKHIYQAVGLGAVAGLAGYGAYKVNKYIGASPKKAVAAASAASGMIGLSTGYGMGRKRTQKKMRKSLGFAK